MDLLAKEKSFTIHQRNIQFLAIELFKVKENLSSAKILKLEQFQNFQKCPLAIYPKLPSQVCDW